MVKQSMIKQKGHRCIYHFCRRHIREITTAQYCQACLFSWIKPYKLLYPSMPPLCHTTCLPSSVALSHADPIYSWPVDLYPVRCTVKCASKEVTSRDSSYEIVFPDSGIQSYDCMIIKMACRFDLLHFYSWSLSQSSVEEYM